MINPIKINTITKIIAIPALPLLSSGSVVFLSVSSMTPVSSSKHMLPQKDSYIHWLYYWSISVAIAIMYAKVQQTG